MNALIDITSMRSSNLPDNSNKELLVLLKQKIEDSIIENRSIVIDFSTPVINCRNTICENDCIIDYEINENSLYIDDGNFELHINFDNNTSIKYEFVEELEITNLTITTNEIEINFCFL